MKLPDDMFKQEILPFLTVHDIVKLDNACMNHKHRLQLLEKINGVILLGDRDESTKASLFKWLAMRRIYLINMMILVSGFYSTVSNLEKDNVDHQFRYTQHVEMRGAIIDDMSIFILSHSPCLLSIDISTIDYGHVVSFPQITDLTLQLIAEHCTGLQSLSLSCCADITHTGLMIILLSKYFSGFTSINASKQAIDDGMVSKLGLLN